MVTKKEKGNLKSNFFRLFVDAPDSNRETFNKGDPYTKGNVAFTADL